MITFLYTWLYVKKIKKFIQSKNFSLTSDEATELIDKTKYFYSKQNVCQLVDDIIMLLWQFSMLILTFANVLTFMMVILLQIILPFFVKHTSDDACQKMMYNISKCL